MSRFDYRSDSIHEQYHEAIRRMSDPHGLGISELSRAEDMTRVQTAFARGTFGRFATIEEWVDETIHPAWQDEALKLVAELRNK